MGVETSSDSSEPCVLWRPSAERIGRSQLSQFSQWLDRQRGLGFADYSELWQWSVTEVEAFWQAIWDYFDVQGRASERVLSSRSMPGAHWFEGAELNYAEHALRLDDDRIAVVSLREDGWREHLSRRRLRDAVARCRAGLKRLGVGKGDRVVAYLPNGSEAVIAFLATASLGAIWSSCPPEFGVDSVLDRFKQIEPKLLIAVDGYAYGGKFFDRSDELARVRDGLPTLEACVLVPRAESSLHDVTLWRELCSTSAPLEFERVPFEHPLWILYSSGTTGLPKAIVHGHGGMLLEHLKELSLHCDLGPTDRFFWFSTTGWMMWNFLIGGLLVGSTVVLYEGSPGYPDLGALWRLIETEQLTYFGTSAPFIMACRKSGLEPEKIANLATLQSVGSTGAPLPKEGFEWVYDHVKRDVLLGSVSGGTDVCTAFIGSCPWLPVRSGELQANALGAKVEAFDAEGHAVTGQVGELVITEPMPCMPVSFWNDPDGERYRESYFSPFPGVWRHGDWIEYLPSGGAVIYGRSDSTLNRGGVRMGTSEFYRVVETLPEVLDSVVVDVGSSDQDGKLWLFLVLAEGKALDAEFEKKLRTTLRERLSPRHVPDTLLAVSEIPRTLSGKKLEVPIKRILSGAPLERAVNPGTLKNPQAIYDLIDAAKGKEGE